jgi:hypothetical protein
MGGASNMQMINGDLLASRLDGWTLLDKGGDPVSLPPDGDDNSRRKVQNVVIDSSAALAPYGLIGVRGPMYFLAITKWSHQTLLVPCSGRGMYR